MTALATKSEAYKVLYGLAQGWSSVVVRMRSGSELRVALRDTIRARGLEEGAVCDDCGEPVHPGTRCPEPHTVAR